MRTKENARDDANDFTVPGFTMDATSVDSQIVSIEDYRGRAALSTRADAIFDAVGCDIVGYQVANRFLADFDRGRVDPAGADRWLSELRMEGMRDLADAVEERIRKRLAR